MNKGVNSEQIYIFETQCVTDPCKLDYRNLYCCKKKLTKVNIIDLHLFI